MNKTFTPQNPFSKKQGDQKEEYVYEPTKQIVNNILSYSKALSVRDSKIIDKVELVLN